MRRGAVLKTIALALTALVGCTDRIPPAPTLLFLEPPYGAVDRANGITIHGEGFALKVFTDFGDESNTAVDARYTVVIAGASLLNVQRNSETALVGTVPAGRPQGFHDVQVTDPWGRTVTLAEGYQALPAGGPPNHLGLAAGGNLEPLTCLPLTVRLLNASNLASPANADTALSFATAPAGILETFSDGACMVAGSAVTVARGQSSAPFSIRGIARGAVRLTATGPNLTAASADYVVGPSSIAFTTAPVTVAAGACSPALTLQTRNPAGAASSVLADTAVALASSAASGFSFFPGAGCAGSPVSGITIPAGSSSAAFSFRASIAGPVDVTASASGLGSSQQANTVTAGPAARFTSAPIGPQGEQTPFLITLRTADQFGNPVNTFTGTADLSGQGGSTLTCLAGCAPATATTAGFVAGAWSGWVALGTAGPGRFIRAVSGTTASGDSATFDVLSVPSTLPQARLRVSPAVVSSAAPGGVVSVDASLSSDYDTAAGALEVSFDCSGTSSNPPGAGGGWTPWSTAKVDTCTYNTAGTYFPRVAVRDPGGAGAELAFATATVVALPAGVVPCIVNTANDADDGATACTGSSADSGTDGVLSLAEAIRLSAAATGRRIITASAPLRLTPRLAPVASQSVGVDLELVFPSGTAFDSYGLTVTAGTVTVANAEITGLRPWRVNGGGVLALSDAQVHDLPTITAAGRLSMNRVEAWSCPASGPCARAEGPTGQLQARFSWFSRAPGGALRAAPLTAGGACAATALDVQSCTFTGGSSGVDNACASDASRVVHSTFHGTGTGARFAGGASHVLQNNVFSASTVAAVQCGSATFAAPGALLGNTVFQNASDGCLTSAADPERRAGDPLYFLAAVGDLRVGGAAPAATAKEAVSAAADLGLDLNDVAPGTLFGSSPDRGGRETP